MNIFFLSLSFFLLTFPVSAQKVIPLKNIHGLYNAYVIPIDDQARIDIQLIILSGSYDEDDISGIAHYTEHLAALSSDAAVLQEPRQRDLNAFTSQVSTVYTNTGTESELDRIMKLTRAVLDTPQLTQSFKESEIDIVKREVYYKERNAPTRWLNRLALQKLYNSKSGRAETPVEDLNKLTVERAIKFHNKHYKPSNSMLIISGNINEKLAQKKVSEYFGSTQKTKRVKDVWLNQRPNKNLNSVTKISTNRLLNNQLSFAKFFRFADLSDILGMQASFFIASDIYNSHLNDILYLDGNIAQSFSQSSYIAINGDIEYTASLIPFEGVTLDQAHKELKNAIKSLRDRSITKKEIEIARAKNVAYAKSLSQSPRAYLDFFQNLGSDGLPPVSPKEFAKMIADAPIKDILKIITAFSSDGPNAAILAKLDVER